MSNGKPRMVHLRDGSSVYRACGDIKTEDEYLTTDLKFITCPRCRVMVARMMRHR